MLIWWMYVAIWLQNYAVVQDLGCCLTINAIIAAGYGIRVVDCGLPQLSMHRSSLFPFSAQSLGFGLEKFMF
jgi:aspartyl aminopeptidase